MLHEIELIWFIAISEWNNYKDVHASDDVKKALVS